MIDGILGLVTRTAIISIPGACLLHPYCNAYYMFILDIF